ncbi:MAG: hypothetical protein M3160_08775, partial [Candidatus Eremiobacteraeota bacterium]|nr:hypothetical protein [Candidatus Eremiobacteraeota bacterium]
MSPLSWFLVAVITWVVLCPILVYVLLTRKSILMTDARSAAFRATVYGPYAVFDAMTTSQEKIDQRKAHKVALVQA